MFLCESMQKYLKGNTFIVSPVVAQKKKIFYTQLQGRRKILNIRGGKSKGGSLEETHCVPQSLELLTRLVFKKHMQAFADCS